MTEDMQCVQGHSAFIFDRGAGRRIAPVRDLSRVQWERARDNMSTGMIRLEGDACSDQAGLLDSIRSHRHELVIFRGDQRVWEGPINRVSTQRGFAEIYAQDIAAYLFATPLTKVWSNATVGGVSHTTEVTTRIGDIIEWEMSHSRVQRYWTGSAWANYTVPAWESLSPPANVLPYLQVHNYPNEARTAAKTDAYQMSVGQHLQYLSRYSGIDYTVVGRALHIWDVSRSLGRLPAWTEANFYEDVIVTEYGSDHAQSAYVVGVDGVYGSALEPDYLDYYGPWTAVYTAYNEEGTVAPTQTELNSQARRNLSGRQPAPIEVRVPDNSSIILTDTLTIQHLIPGTQVELRATLGARQVAQLQKIDHVTVTETGAEGENVAVTLTPATKPDDSVPE